MGLPFLRVVWFCGDVIGGHCRSVAGFLLLDRTFGGSNALCRPHWHSAGDWVDDGDSGLGVRLLFFGLLRSAYRSDYRLHLRSRACLHGNCEDAVLQGEEDGKSPTELVTR